MTTGPFFSASASENLISLPAIDAGAVKSGACAPSFKAADACNETATANTSARFIGYLRLRRELPVRQQPRDRVAQVLHRADPRQLLVRNAHAQLLLEVADQLHHRHRI